MKRVNNYLVFLIGAYLRPKIQSTIIALAMMLFFNSVKSGEAVWYPLYGGRGDAYVPITSVGKMGSEAILLALGPGTLWDTSQYLPSNTISIDFPSIFIGKCIYSLEFRQEWDNKILATNLPGNSGSYKYEIGNGWLLHLKGNASKSSERFSSSLGWIFISNYPWIYGLDFGWRYVIEDGTAWNANAWWLFEPGFGWFWTTRNFYPFVLREPEGWVLYGAEVS